MPASFPAALAAEPGIASVSLFDGGVGTPTLAQMQQYDIVIPWSNQPWIDPTALGNNLGSYLAGGGIVVAFNFDWFAGPQTIGGTWSTTYTPFNAPATQNFTNGTLGTCTVSQLCTGVTTLNSFYRETATLAPGATLAGTWNDGTPMIAYKGRAIGVSAYVGDGPTNYSGHFSRVVSNTAAWLMPPCTASVSGTVSQCASPTPSALAGATLTATGTSGTSTVTNGSGGYLLNLTAGGNYTITPTKAARPTASAGINTADVVAVQRHLLSISLLTGCRFTAGDCAAPAGINTTDVIAIQRFTLGLSTGLGNVGQYSFTPANRIYSPLSNQSGQNYDVVVFGDVSPAFAIPRPAGDPSSDASSIPADTQVLLPEVQSNQSTRSFVAPVTATAINSGSKLVGFQGDITFDERSIAFDTDPVQKAGLTAKNWNVTGNVLDGPGPIRTLRISAYSLDFAPLSGRGTLFELKMNRVTKGSGDSRLEWDPASDGFYFIDADVNVRPAATR